MLRLSNKGLYGIKALYELACNYGSGPLNIRQISERHGLPVPFLEQVLHTLKKQGIVESKRGASGGYILSKSPDLISIGDAVRALEGPIALCDCLQQHESDSVDEKIKNCVTSDIYRKIGLIVENAFDSVFLSDLTETSDGTVNVGTCNIERRVG